MKIEASSFAIPEHVVGSWANAKMCLNLGYHRRPLYTKPVGAQQGYPSSSKCSRWSQRGDQTISFRCQQSLLRAEVAHASSCRATLSVGLYPWLSPYEIFHTSWVAFTGRIPIYCGHRDAFRVQILQSGSLTGSGEVLGTWNAIKEF